MDDANDSAADVIGDVLTLTAAGGIGQSGGNGSLDTSANSLTAAVTAAGLIHLNETDAVTLTSRDHGQRADHGHRGRADHGRRR